MNTTIKTLILAAAGAALIAASPASAQTKRQAIEPDYAPFASPLQNRPLVSPLQNGPFGLWQNAPTTFNSADTYGQIRGEYLKDSPTHNGNSF